MMIPVKIFSGLTSSQVDLLRIAVWRQNGVLRASVKNGTAIALFPKEGYLTPKQRLIDVMFDLEGNGLRL